MTEIDERYLDVNSYGVLSIPLHLWLGMFVMARHWIFIFIGLASVLVRPAESTQLTAGTLSWIALLFEVPVLVLIIAGFSRLPSAGYQIRRVWNSGILILGLTMTCNMGLLVWWLYQVANWERWPELFLASCSLMDIAIFWGACSSPYIRQIFLEFPPTTKNTL